MDFKTREVKFRVTDKSQYNEAAVKSALKAQGFSTSEVKSGPS
jgi:hypothetical protein